MKDLNLGTNCEVLSQQGVNRDSPGSPMGLDWDWTGIGLGLDWDWSGSPREWLGSPVQPMGECNIQEATVGDSGWGSN
jgi:hypothetical protein